MSSNFTRLTKAANARNAAVAGLGVAGVTGVALASRRALDRHIYGSRLNHSPHSPAPTLKTPEATGVDVIPRNPASSAALRHHWAQATGRSGAAPPKSGIQGESTPEATGRIVDATPTSTPAPSVFDHISSVAKANTERAATGVAKAKARVAEALSEHNGVGSLKGIMDRYRAAPYGTKHLSQPQGKGVDLADAMKPTPDAEKLLSSLHNKGLFGHISPEHAVGYGAAAAGAAGLAYYAKKRWDKFQKNRQLQKQYGLR